LRRRGNFKANGRVYIAHQNEKEERMTKIKLLGATAVLSLVLVGPCLAQHAIARPDHNARSNYCATREPGNPYSKEEDYMAWSGWRARGGWDSRGDDACLRNPHISHPQAGF
jgi:hypothetical protein